MGRRYLPGLAAGLFLLRGDAVGAAARWQDRRHHGPRQSHEHIRRRACTYSGEICVIKWTQNGGKLMHFTTHELPGVGTASYGRGYVPEQRCECHQAHSELGYADAPGPAQVRGVRRE